MFQQNDTNELFIKKTHKKQLVRAYFLNMMHLQIGRV